MGATSKPKTNWLGWIAWGLHICFILSVPTFLAVFDGAAVKREWSLWEICALSAIFQIWLFVTLSSVMGDGGNTAGLIPKKEEKRKIGFR